MLVIIYFRFTCGEEKLCQNDKKSINVLFKNVGRILHYTLKKDVFNTLAFRTVDYFRKKAPSYILDKVLNTSLRISKPFLEMSDFTFNE